MMFLSGFKLVAQNIILIVVNAMLFFFLSFHILTHLTHFTRFLGNFYIITFCSMLCTDFTKAYSFFVKSMAINVILIQI